MTADKTILILAANPSDTVRFRLSHEVREITEGLRLSDRRDRFQLIYRGAVQAEDLRRAPRQHKPQVVHFWGQLNACYSQVQAQAIGQTNSPTTHTA